MTSSRRCRPFDCRVFFWILNPFRAFFFICNLNIFYFKRKKRNTGGNERRALLSVNRLTDIKTLKTYRQKAQSGYADTFLFFFTDIVCYTLIDIYAFWKWWGKTAIEKNKERQKGGKRDRRRDANNVQFLCEGLFSKRTQGRHALSGRRIITTIIVIIVIID